MKRTICFILACALFFSCSLSALISGTGKLVEISNSDGAKFEQIVKTSNDVPVMVLMYRASDADDVSEEVDKVARDKAYSSVKFYKVEIDDSSNRFVGKSGNCVGDCVREMAGLDSNFKTPILVTFKNGEKYGTPKQGALAISEDSVKQLADQCKPADNAEACDGDDCAEPDDGEACDGDDCARPSDDDGEAECDDGNCTKPEGCVTELASGAELKSKVIDCTNCIAVVDYYKSECPNCTAIATAMDTLCKDSEFANVAFYKAYAWNDYGSSTHKGFDDYADAALSVISGDADNTPNVVVYKNGQPICGFAGYKSVSDFKSFLKECIENGCVGDDCTKPEGGTQGGNTQGGNTQGGNTQGGNTQGGSNQQSQGYVEITSDDDYKRLVANNTSDIIVVDFWKGQCALCFYMEQKLKTLASEDKYKNVKFYNVQAYGTNWPTDENDVSKIDWDMFESDYKQEFLDAGYTYSGRNLATFQQIEEWSWMQHSGDENELRAFFNKGKQNRWIAYSYISQAENKLSSSDFLGADGYTPTVIIFKNGVPKKSISGSSGQGYAISMDVIRGALDSVL